MILGEVGTFVVANKGALEAIGAIFLQLLTAVAALTPTATDDNVVHRIQNLWAMLLGKDTTPAAPTAPAA